MWDIDASEQPQEARASPPRYLEYLKISSPSMFLLLPVLFPQPHPSSRKSELSALELALKEGENFH